MKTGEDTPYLFLRNDDVISPESPAVYLDDASIVQGHGLFETLRIYEATPFALNEHLDRMTSGCERLGLHAPTLLEADTSIQRLLEVNGITEGGTFRLRITITGGTNEQVTFYQLSSCPSHPETADVITGPRFVRNEQGLLSGVKTLSYGENAIASRITKQSRATEALWSNTRKELCEGTWSNVFVRIDGRWRTPPLSSGCLAGVTRWIALSIASKVGMETTESPLPIASLDEVEASFLTSSIREIQPVSSIDGRPLDISSAPEMTALQDCFRDYVTASIRQS